jgi:GNAT superfamily N-acetyltransferase
LTTTSVNDVGIESLTAADPAFAALTFPRYWHLWKEGAAVTAIAAWRGREPVGLVIVAPFPVDDPPPFRIASLAVAAAHRRLGIGRRLLRATEQHAAAAGVRRMVAQHSSRMPMRDAYERLLRGAGWRSPRAIYQRVAARAEIGKQWRRDLHGLVARLDRLGCRAEPWASVTEADSLYIRQQCIATALRPSLHPSVHAAASDPHVSIVLRHHDQVAGWVMGQTAPDSGQVYYALAHVWPRYQRFGWLQVGMLEAVRRQAETYGPDSVLTFDTRADNPQMRAFIDRRFMERGPLWVETRFESDKLLSD